MGDENKLFITVHRLAAGRFICRMRAKTRSGPTGAGGSPLLVEVAR
jgi:hypothetical protein